MSLPPEPPCCVYRAYDADGVALYVGQTQDLEQRMKSHRGTTWFGQMARLEHDWYADRSWARRAEARWIQELRPVFNTQSAGYTIKESELRAKAYALKVQGQACAHCQGTGIDASATPTGVAFTSAPFEIVRQQIASAPVAPAEFQQAYKARCAEFLARHNCATFDEFWDAVRYWDDIEMQAAS